MHPHTQYSTARAHTNTHLHINKIAGFGLELRDSHFQLASYAKRKMFIISRHVFNLSRVLSDILLSRFLLVLVPTKTRRRKGISCQTVYASCSRWSLNFEAKNAIEREIQKQFKFKHPRHHLEWRRLCHLEQGVGWRARGRWS